MNNLPKSAGLASYVVVTTVMCMITYVLVYYLRQLQDVILRGRSSVRELLHMWKNEEAEQRVDEFGLTGSTPKRANTMV